MSERYRGTSTYSFQNEATRVRNISDKVWLCDVHDTLLIRLLGGLNSGSSRFGFSSHSDCKIEWIEDGLIPTNDQLAGPVGLPDGVGEDCYGIPVYGPGIEDVFQVQNAAIFMAGMIAELNLPAGVYTPGSGVIPNREHVWIKSVDTFANTITVIRGFAGTPVYSYDGTEGVCIVATAGLECQEQQNNYLTRRDTMENYFQIFHGGWDMTKKFMKTTETYGVGSAEQELARHRTKIMGGSIDGRNTSGLLPIQLERAVLGMGGGIATPGGPNYPGIMKGITDFNINKPIVPDLTYDVLCEWTQYAWQNGGMPNTLVVSPAVKKKINSWALGRESNSTREDRGFGVMVESIDFDFVGKMDILVHRHMRQNEALLLDIDKMGLIELWGFEETTFQNPDTALCHKIQVDAAYSFALACECHHTWFRIDNACFDQGCPINTCYSEPDAPERCHPGEPVDPDPAPAPAPASMDEKLAAKMEAKLNG